MLGKITVEIGGKTRHLTFGQNAWFIFTKLYKITPDKIPAYLSERIESPSAWRDIIYCAMQVENLRNKEAIDFNEFDVGDWLDEMNNDDLSNVIICIFDSLNIPTTEIKKKLGIKNIK